MSKLKEEQYYGNTEYKVRFVDITPKKIEKYATQLKFRLIEGRGHAFYYIGVSDDGNIVGVDVDKIDFHIETMNKIAKAVESQIDNYKILPIKNKPEKFIYFKIISRFSFDDIFLITD